MAIRLEVTEVPSGMKPTDIPEPIGNDDIYPEHINRRLDVSISEFGDDDDSKHPRIYFREVLDFMRRYFPRYIIRPTTVVTAILTKTVTFTNTFTTTYTYFLQRCTPSPFPFKECSKKIIESSSELSFVKLSHADL